MDSTHLADPGQELPTTSSTRRPLAATPTATRQIAMPRAAQGLTGWGLLIPTAAPRPDNLALALTCTTDGGQEDSTLADPDLATLPRDLKAKAIHTLISIR